MEFNHHNCDVLYQSLIKTFTQHFKLKSFITDKIKETRGGEKLLWIKKYNTSFIHPWKNK